MLDAIPARPGAYGLEIVLDRPLAIETARLRGSLPAGAYAYAGSAHGPGGLRARIARHLKSEKRPHWHIDRLTIAGRVTGIAFAENADGSTASECEIARALAALPDAAVPLAGFGSSDCRRCQAHLIRQPGAGLPVSAITDIGAMRYLAVPQAAVSRGAS